MHTAEVLCESENTTANNANSKKKRLNTIMLVIRPCPVGTEVLIQARCCREIDTTRKCDRGKSDGHLI